MIISKIILNNYRLYQGVNEIEFKAKNGKIFILFLGKMDLVKPRFSIL